jgi:TPR repeat protein
MRPPPFPPKWETNITSLVATAEKGDEMAQFCAGLQYIYGVGTRQNLTNAVQWLKKSADQNFAPAEYTLGILYKNGVGVSTNRITADELFKKAADQGYIPAKHEAALTADRNGNRAEALKLLREAAEGGFPSSEYLMGCVATDPVESYVWHSLAAPNVELASTRQLELRQQLTKEQLAQADERVRQFKEKRASQAHPSP